MTLLYNVTGDGTTAGAATPGTDLTPISGTVTIPAGAASATFTLAAVSDAALEGLEGFKVSLFNSTTAAPLNVTRNGLITDDPNAPLPSLSFTLTTSADSGSSVTGGAGNDSYIGSYIADSGTGTTINAGDTLDGKGGVDTLIISVSGASTAAQNITSVNLSNVEKVLVSNFDSNANDAHDTDVNAILWTGVTTVGLSASSATGDTSFSNVGNIVVAEMSSGSGDLTIDYTDSVLTGAADNQVLNISALGTAGGTFAVDSTIETLSVNATGSASTLAGITAAGATRMTVNASAALTITGALSTTLLTVDASASTAAVSLAATAAADYTITGGAGNDTVDIGNELTTGDSLTGGGGTDTLVVTDSSDLVANLKVSGFEVVRLSENGQTADLQYLTGINQIDYRVGVGSATTATNVAEGTAVLISADAATLTHTVINATNTGTTNTVNLVIDHDTAETDIDVTTAFVAAGVETLNITSSGIASPATAVNTSENRIESLAGSTNLTSINVSGASDFLLTSTGALSTITSINASAMTGRFTVTNASTATATTTVQGGSAGDTLTGRSGLDNISGGGGNDTIDGADGNDVIAGDAGNDSITGGTGNDVITGGDGNDTIDSETNIDNVSGGAGDDIFVISNTYTTNLTLADTISGGSGVDTLRFTLAGDTAINLVTNSAILTNVTGIDRIGLGAAAAQTLTINDLALSVSDGSSLTAIADTNQAHVVNASGVLNSNATVSFVMGTAVTNATTLTYSVGNAKDNVAFGVADGEVSVTNMAFLSSTDTIVGGSGVGDQVTITDDNAVTVDTSVSGHRLAGLSGVETISINTTDGTDTADYTITLSNSFIAANYDAATGQFTITRDALDTGDTDVIGTSVTGYNLNVTGGTAADTISGGSGNDTLEGGDGIDTVNGGAGNDRIIGTDATDATDADSLTGGAGNDVFVYDATPTGVDTITDFALPTNNGATAASVNDTIELDGRNFTFNGGAGTAVDSIALLSAGLAAATVDVLILDTQTYATVTAADIALAAAVAPSNNDMIFIWADSFGQVHVSYTLDRDTAGGAVDVAVLSGVTITGVASVVTTANAAMFDTLV